MRLPRIFLTSALVIVVSRAWVALSLRAVASLVCETRDRDPRGSRAL